MASSDGILQRSCSVKMCFAPASPAWAKIFCPINFPLADRREGIRAVFGRRLVRVDRHVFVEILDMQQRKSAGVELEIVQRVNSGIE